MKNNKGITLIALVVTIIVLLILAGVSIAMLSGQDGILNRASEATYLESNLLKIPGVKGPVKFDFMKRQCTVIYNSYQISVKDIINEIKVYHIDASAISDSFRRLSKEEEKAILGLPINKTNDILCPLNEIYINNNDNKLVEIDHDEAETEICKFYNIKKYKYYEIIFC